MESSTDCKFCLESFEKGEEKLSPCGCTGTVSFVHRECLERWRLTTGQDRTCNICKQEYAYPGMQIVPVEVQIPICDDGFIIEEETDTCESRTISFMMFASVAIAYLLISTFLTVAMIIYGNYTVESATVLGMIIPIACCVCCGALCK